jgi:hypothetical protein
VCAVRCSCKGGEVVTDKVYCKAPTTCGSSPAAAGGSQGLLNIDALLDKYSLKGGKLEDNAGDKSLRYVRANLIRDRSTE